MTERDTNLQTGTKHPVNLVGGGKFANVFIYKSTLHVDALDAKLVEVDSEIKKLK